MFHYFLDKKKLFYSKKITIFQKAKNDIFPKRVTQDLCQKNSKFSFTFLGEK